MYDLTQKLSHLTPPWPTYEPLQIKFFKRLSSNGANGQVITTSNHVGTHLDGSLHFCTHGRDIASIPLTDLIGPGVVVDVSDIAADYGIYTSKDIMERADVREGDILVIHTGYIKYAWDQPEADEVRYMVKHPGPTREFSEWCRKMKFKYLAVDAGSCDQPHSVRHGYAQPLQNPEQHSAGLPFHRHRLRQRRCRLHVSWKNRAGTCPNWPVWDGCRR
jgi:kynurenine formamidase